MSLPVEELRRGEQGRAERLLAITGAIADAIGPEKVYEALVDHLSAAVNASSAALWLVEDDGKTMCLARALGYDDSAKASLASLPLDLEPPMPIIDAVRRREALFIPSQPALRERYPNLEPVMTEGRSYRVCCLPLIVHGRALGALGITIEEAREADEDERDFLVLVASYAGQALERLRLFDAERRLHREAADARTRAEHLYRFAQAAVAANQLSDVYEAALTAIEGALAVPRSAALTVDSDGVMRFKAWRGLSDAYRAAVEGHSPWPRDAVAPEAVLISDAGRDPSLAAYRELFKSERIGALAFIPLVNAGTLLGKFMLYYERPHMFSPQELETAGAIASHLASVIARFTVVARLEETLRYNELFAGVLAHDLRTPLGAMTTAAQVVLMQREGEQASREAENKPLSRILSSGQRMRVMIDQLLDLTRARSGGGIELQPSQTNLGDLCAHAIEELELSNPEWAIDHETVGDLTGWWDAARLVQVVSNLVSNAGQHGARGGAIWVTIEGRRRDQVRLTVHNDGVIPETMLPQLFDPFRRTRGGNVRGLGLGLFIVREIVQAHGGTVDLTSDEVGGTTFTVVLPRRRG